MTATTTPIASTRSPRRWMRAGTTAAVALFAGAALAAAGPAAATTPDGTTPDGTTPDGTADDVAAADEAAGVVLIDAGDQADTVVLSLDWRAVTQAGTGLRNVERTESGGSIAVAGQSIEIQATQELIETREVLTADDTGMTVRVIVESYTLEAADEISEQTTGGELRGTIVGIPAIVSYDADGERIGAEFEEELDADWEQRAALDELLDDADPLALPVTAVGVGARWTAPLGEAGGDELMMVAEFELVELTETSATLEFYVPDIAAAFVNDTDLANATAGPDSFMRGTVTVSRPDTPVHFEMAADARLQFSIDDPETGITYEYDLLTTRSASLTTSVTTV